ncbi:MAG: HisA/HisF-related TIM barrel protein [Thermoanaerobaculia bacterium]
MELIPSIDLLGGRVVRLENGRRDRVTVYFDDPLEAIARFREAGARRIHVVDLDAAFGQPRQRTVLARIASACGDEQLELGGGLRSAEAVADALDHGYERVVLGSLPAREPALFEELVRRHPGRIVPAWESDGGELRVGGWESAHPVVRSEFSGRIRNLARELPAILVTDIARDGMQVGANVELAVEVARETGVPAIVSGGVASLADLERAAARPEISGLIVGRAYYEGAFDLREAKALCPEHREVPA